MPTTPPRDWAASRQRGCGEHRQDVDRDHANGQPAVSVAWGVGIVVIGVLRSTPMSAPGNTLPAKCAQPLPGQAATPPQEPGDRRQRVDVRGREAGIERHGTGDRDQPTTSDDMDLPARPGSTLLHGRAASSGCAVRSLSTTAARVRCPHAAVRERRGTFMPGWSASMDGQVRRSARPRACSRQSRSERARTRCGSA
jgi:hypothetical protein